MRTQQAPLIKLKNYRPSAFGIDEVDLKFVLSPNRTQVTARLQIAREHSTPAGAPLVLDGDSLILKSVKIDGVPHTNFVADETSLTLSSLPKENQFELEIETEIAPVTNTKLMGLYQSQGVYCTQCEAEGFRRITYFLDRPDILSTYQVRIEADQKECPILLSNGNPGKKGKLKGGRHFAQWHDPHAKPCYLFALVAGQLDVHSSSFKTKSGKRVALNIYVEPGKANQAEFAMAALKRSMTWDEQNYGCEYDLDVFNIVAVSDFNMGAMENKGLNVFNDKYVLANPEIATDADYANIEAIIAHEYFHNWTGNRITCRDWFQLCLKEGLTVYRDQEFSADVRSRATQRIQQVRTLKAMQFPEDGGPLAHPVRPSAYREINNFYTATVYQKGAELVRMLATMAGAENYRKATDLYFKNHDGRAAIMEDFLESFEGSLSEVLPAFSNWYSQAGTPTVNVERNYDRKTKRLELLFSQSTPATPGQKTKRAVPIPIRLGLLDKSGKEIKLNTSHPLVDGDVFVLLKNKQKFILENVLENPALSLLRGFSAPVLLNLSEKGSEKLIRAAHDPDPYNRWFALNELAVDQIKKGAKKGRGHAWINPKYLAAFTSTVLDTQLDAEFRAQVMNLPTVADIARTIGKGVDPERIQWARDTLTKHIGKSLGEDGLKIFEKLKRAETKAEFLQQVGIRALKNAHLHFAVASKIDGAVKTAQTQFARSKNMTDKMASLMCLTHLQSDPKIAEAALSEFYNQHRGNSLIIDKWFSLQATIPGKGAFNKIRKLSKHPDFTLNNPNRARSLLGPFANNNLSGFHREDGKGYEFYANQIIELDRINPQVSARMLTLMNNWKMFSSKRKSAALKSLKRIAKTDGLSRDTQEIVDRMIN